MNTFAYPLILILAALVVVAMLQQCATDASADELPPMPTMSATWFWPTPTVQPVIVFIPMVSK